MSKKNKTNEELLEVTLVQEEEQPYVLPENWVWVQLFPLLESLESGKRPKGGVSDIKEGIPSIGGEHLTYNGGFNFTNIKYVPDEFANSMKKGIIEKNDILIVKDGATTGKTSYVTSEFPFEKAVVNEHIFLCRVSKNINSKYLFYYIVSPQGLKNIRGNIKGSAQGGINTSFASNFPVPLISLNEQKRIADKVERLLNKIEEAKQLIEEAKETFELRRAAILDKAFRGELSKYWREINKHVEDAGMLYIKIKESQSGKIKPTKAINEDELRYTLPLTWKWVRLGDVLKITSGGTPKRTVSEYYDGDIPWVKTGEVKWNYIYSSAESITSDAVANSSAKLLPRDSVLVAMYGQGLTRGRASILAIEATCNQAVCALLPNDYILPEFLYYYFMEGYHRFRQVAKGGNQENLSATMISEFLFPLPPLEEQGAIIEIIQSILAKENTVKEVIGVEMNIEKLKESILLRAFRGNLGTNDSNEENAIELLKEVLQEQVK